MGHQITVLLLVARSHAPPSPAVRRRGPRTRWCVVLLVYSWSSFGRSLQLLPCRLSRTRFHWSQPLSYNALVARVKRAVAMLGLAKDDYSGHSLRAWGAPIFLSHALHTM